MSLCFSWQHGIRDNIPGWTWWFMVSALSPKLLLLLLLLFLHFLFTHWSFSIILHFCIFISSLASYNLIVYIYTIMIIKIFKVKVCICVSDNPSFGPKLCKCKFCRKHALTWPKKKCSGKITKCGWNLFCSWKVSFANLSKYCYGLNCFWSELCVTCKLYDLFITSLLCVDPFCRKPLLKYTYLVFQPLVFSDFHHKHQNLFHKLKNNKWNKCGFHWL